MKKLWTLVGLAAALGSLAAAGCKNNNMFGGFHKRGSGDPAALLSDAKAALTNREFSNAKAYYEAVLAQEPKNSEALYGAATATMGTAGLDLGTLLANVVTAKNSGAPAATLGLQDVLQTASIGTASAITEDEINSLSILKGLDLDNLSGSIDQIVCFLLKIRSGNADGKISPKDISVLLSVGITCILRGILRPLEVNVIDLRQTADGKDYDVVIIDGAKLKDICDSGVLQNSVTDLAGALQSMQTAVLELNSTSGSTLGGLKQDLETAFNQFKKKINDEAAAQGLTTQIQSCLDFVNNFEVDKLQPPTKDPGDCLNKSNTPLH